LDNRENDEDDDERVLEAGEKLEEPMRRFLARDLVRPNLLETFESLGLDEAVQAAANVRNRDFKVVGRFADGARRHRFEAVSPRAFAPYVL
jgi:hypothetical protein